MKKIAIFFCDIEGTYLHKYESNGSDVKKFIKCIKELNNNIIFSFTSQCNQETIDNCINEITPYTQKYNVILGRQIYEGGYIENNQNHITNTISKLSQMLTYIKELNTQYEIEKIYYAEDNELTQYMFKELIEELGYNIDIIIPTSGGCNDLTNVINEKYLNNKLKKKNYPNG